MATTEKIRERIELLLRKAESTTAAEAEALTEAAEKLMIKYAIESASLNLEGDEPIVIRSLHFGGGFGTALASAALTVAAAFKIFGIYWPTNSARGTDLISGKQKNGRPVDLVGHARDLDLAIPIIRSILLQAVTAADNWAREGDANDYLWQVSGRHLLQVSIRDYRMQQRRAFIRSFAEGVATRIGENLRQVAATETGAGTGLVLTDNFERAERWYKERYQVSIGRRQSAISRETHDAGHAAGRDAAVGEDELTAGRAITA